MAFWSLVALPWALLRDAPSHPLSACKLVLVGAVVVVIAASSAFKSHIFCGIAGAV